MSKFEAAAKRSNGSEPPRGACRKCKGFRFVLRAALGAFRAWRLCDRCDGSGRS